MLCLMRLIDTEGHLNASLLTSLRDRRRPMWLCSCVDLSRSWHCLTNSGGPGRDERGDLSHTTAPTAEVTLPTGSQLVSIRRSTVFRRILKPCAVLTALAAAVSVWNGAAPPALPRLALSPTAHNLLGEHRVFPRRTRSTLHADVWRVAH